MLHWRVCMCESLAQKAGECQHIVVVLHRIISSNFAVPSRYAMRCTGQIYLSHEANLHEPCVELALGDGTV